MQAHLNDLRAEVDDNVADQVAEDWRQADLPEATRAVLAFAEQLTVKPNTMTQDNVRDLRAAGFTDADIHDITQITAYFNYINRIADALGVPPEKMMKPWPREDGDW